VVGDGVAVLVEPVVLDVPVVPVVPVVELAEGTIAVEPAYVLAASQAMPLVAVMPARAVPIVMFRSRRIARARSLVRWGVVVSMAGIVDPASFRIRDDGLRATLAPRYRRSYDAVTPSSPRTGPVHVRFGGWMHGPAMDRWEWRFSPWRR
jgi:hypothetical protein